MDNKRMIRVTGKGQIKVRPDIIRITMTLEGTYPEYGEALRRSARDTDCLRDILLTFGFGKSDLKTISFHVDTEYEGYQERGAYKQRFVGYKFCHLMKVELASENDQLGEILYALANSPVRPEFRISYTVKDKEAVKNELLGNAVTDARKKALVLAKAADVALGDIQRIDYAWEEGDFEVRPMGKALMAEASQMDASGYGANCYDLGIEPDDIEVSDSVTVVWGIR